MDRATPDDDIYREADADILGRECIILIIKSLSALYLTNNTGEVIATSFCFAVLPS